MGESERFSARSIGDPEEWTCYAGVLPSRSSTGVNKPPICDETMAAGSRMLFMISFVPFLDTISVLLVLYFYEADSPFL